MADFCILWQITGSLRSTGYNMPLYQQVVGREGLWVEA